MEHSPVVRYTRFILKHRVLVILASILTIMGVGYGASKLVFINDYRYFFSEKNPNLMAFEQLQRTYSSPDQLLWVVQPNDEDRQVTDPEVLQVIHKMTERAWQTPFVARVDSLTNFQRTFAEEDDLIVEDMVPDPFDLSRDQADEIRDYALNEPILINRMISPNARTTAVVATLRLPEGDNAANDSAIAFGRALQAEIRAAHPDLRIELTGPVALSNAFSEAAMSDASLLTPLMYLVIGLAVLLLLRSFIGLGVTVVVVTVAVIGGIGGQGWLGIPLTPPSASASTVILTVAVADSIHVLVTALVQMSKGKAKDDAIIESMRVNFGPVFLTSVTTAIGFLSLNFSDAPPFRDLGTISAMGTMVAWAASITLLPAMLSLLPLKAHKQVASQTKLMDGFAEFTIRRQKPLLIGSLAVIIVLASAIPTLKFNDVFPDFFSERFDFRRATDFASENLTTVYQLHYSLEAKESNGISEPEYMNNVEALASWFRDQPEVLNVSAVTDVMKKVNRSMHGDAPDEYKLPQSRDMNAQFLLLYEMSLPYGLDLNDQINVDKSATRMIVTIHQINTTKMNNLISRADDWVQANMPPYMADIHPAGHAVMFGFISRSNFERMTVGTGLALLLISGCLMIALRSFRLGLISLVPNVLPPIAAFGIFALTMDAIGMYASFVVATALGLIVDATVHFLSKFRTARVDFGNSAEDAVRYAFSNTGTALLVSTLVLIMGFAVLATSGFLLNSMMGLMVSVTIAVALILDFLLLPPLLILIERNKQRGPVSQPASAQAGE